MIVDLTSSGWTPKPSKIEKLCETLEKLNLTEIDTVVINPMSNYAYLGTDEDGLPIPAEKSDEDGRYHLFGDLQLAPTSAFKNCLKHMEKMLAFVGGAKVVFVIPLPRYILSGCCKNTEHVSHRLSGKLAGELAAKFAGAEKCLLEAAAIGERTGKARLINLLSFFGSGESPPQDNRGRDEHLGWRRSPPDLQCQQGHRQEADGRPGQRRRRRRTSQQESETVPAPAPAKKKVAATGQPPTSLPRPVPPPPPLWLSGHLPPSQRGRGSGRQNPNQRGEGPVRGSARGGNRGANQGQRGPLRGGQRGRWGCW
jgi:hypothetical protein